MARQRDYRPWVVAVLVSGLLIYVCISKFIIQAWSSTAGIFVLCWTGLWAFGMARHYRRLEARRSPC